MKTENNQPKHTQGEWKAEIWGGIPFAIITGKDGVIAEIDSRNREANARLIASAPEMLEALQKCVKAMENSNCDSLITDRAKVVIKKATGQ